MASNRSPSPLPSRTCRNSEKNSINRKSFSGNPFASPNPLVNSKNANPSSPANSPSVTSDQMKRNSIFRRSTGNSPVSEDEKENHLKDMIRSPAKRCTKNFMAPTISAASKFTPSPRKKILGEKNELSKTSIQFTDKDFALKPESTVVNEPTKIEEAITVDQKDEVLETATPVHEVTFSSITDEKEALSDVTQNSDVVKDRPFCCSPQTSPIIIAPVDANRSLLPYDPKINFLSPRPQFLRYKPNPRIESLLRENGNQGYGEEDVTRVDDSFESDVSSDTEEKENQENKSESRDLVHGSSEDLSEIVSEEKQSDSMVVQALKLSESDDLVRGSSEDSSEIASEEKQSVSMVVEAFKLSKPLKPRFFTRSKTVSFLVVMFLVACFSLSFTDSPPMDLPIYKDVSFSEVYHESLKFAAFAQESFDGLVENLKQWSIKLVSCLSDQISHSASSTHGSIQFYNLTTSPIKEESVFNPHIRPDFSEAKTHDVIQEVEEMEDDEEIFEEVDEEVDVADELLTEETSKLESDEVFQSDGEGLIGTKSNLGDGLSDVSRSASEMEATDLEKESRSSDSAAEAPSETFLSSFLNNRSINRSVLAGFATVIMAISAVIYMIKRKSDATKPATVHVDNNMCREFSSSGSTSSQKRLKKKTINNKRESLASSSSDISGASPSYGSFTTVGRIPIKHGDEVMVTPIRRSSRLLKK